MNKIVRSVITDKFLKAILLVVLGMLVYAPAALSQDLPAYQVMQRTKLAAGKYHYLFDYKSSNRIVLRNI